MTALRVAMPMLTLVPGGMGGSETAVRELIGALATRPEIELAGYVGMHAEGWLDGTGISERLLPQVRGGLSTSARLRAMGSSFTSPGVARAVREGADVVHYPFTVPVPVERSIPTVISLYDVQHLDLPHLFSRAELSLRRFTYDRAAQRADAVVTISEFSRSRITYLLGIPPDRVHVAPLGVSPTFTPDRTVARENFVLYPARHWPHKNHARLIEAMTMVRDNLPDLRLVLTGADRRVTSWPKWVDQRGAVGKSELLSMYRRAGCLAYPSLYEGFGMPPLEAMATGCPVVVSTAGALPEVCGELATYCDPTSAESIARAIECAIGNPTKNFQAGLERAQLFTWGACADIHLDIYQSLSRQR
jgi:glycosyltransferase involved in cell wall biosynthesis